MEKTEQKLIGISTSAKEEIDWSEYLDYTRFFKPAEINNMYQELFKKDFEKNK